MIFLNLDRLAKAKKVLLPGILNKELKPVSSLLKPSDIIVPMFFVSVLAQLSDNLKDFLDAKELENLVSIRTYRKVIFSGFNSVSLTVVQAISRTLGPELETLSSLNVYERVIFLKELQLKIMLDKSVGKIDFRQRNLNNPSQLMKHRKGLSIQSRSIMIASSIFSPSSVTMGIPVSSIDLSLILSSSRLVWLSLGLLEEDFEFFFKKEAINKSKKLKVDFDFLYCFDDISFLKTILYFELQDFLVTNSLLDFSMDNVIIKGENNLVLLEKQLGFVKRDLPIVPNEVFVTDEKLDDVLLRAALQQRREQKLSFENVFAVSTPFRKKSSQSLKTIRLKKFFHEN